MIKIFEPPFPFPFDILRYALFHLFPISSQESVESSLQIVHDIATENIGTLCMSTQYTALKIPLTTARYDGVRQKSDLASSILQELGFNRHSGEHKLFSFDLIFLVAADEKVFPLTMSTTQVY